VKILSAFRSGKLAILLKNGASFSPRRSISPRKTEKSERKLDREGKAPALDVKNVSVKIK